MSHVSIHKEVCPKCGKEQMIERYDSVNDYHKVLFPKIADGTIFDYTCCQCKETIHTPYPLLFHKMGVKDIQIGYKISPIQPALQFSNPMMAIMKRVMEQAGHDPQDIFETYEDEESFQKRVAEFL